MLRYPLYINDMSNNDKIYQNINETFFSTMFYTELLPNAYSRILEELTWGV